MILIQIAGIGGILATNKQTDSGGYKAALQLENNWSLVIKSTALDSESV